MILKNLITVGTFTTLMFAASAFIQKEDKQQKAQHHPVSENNGFAVLELFTSEGCSSCPPADDLMGKIEKEYQNEPVYILSYHVDYWNRLGWKDRFSTAENSQRQQQYSRTLGSQVYTPQLIVNGKTEFVGSDSNAITTTIDKELLHSKNTKIDLNAKAFQNQATVQYSTISTDAKNVLLVNLVEKQSSTQVGKGENEGRHLQHWQIVHQQKSISLYKQHEGVTTFTLPDGFSPSQWEIVAFIQNPKTGQIFGSAKTAFN
ncbi:DUF1223 domain-containing protein [Chryseobacterium lactis]|uniref:DUF1223 domain-containing protein n=1 Tax=Chryseobacterium lactis TaxID=1241981 RepID=A0A3G6RRV2_CHRLC|nr:DUF1223 domain-containing protein [Chryseobacterium lactis]AZA84228.1 DUF1223 domain-containing protein [Chryseobacterium lactis]AZB04616.1 DUF1223 domain-containing protein [Chryseobacterium lactis]PNW14347.1 DUF1223 domain-containing protein [Chryseobacterium lactis]